MLFYCQFAAQFDVLFRPVFPFPMGQLGIVYDKALCWQQL
jgi:hypothetical protein